MGNTQKSLRLDMLLLEIPAAEIDIFSCSIIINANK